MSTEKQELTETETKVAERRSTPKPEPPPSKKPELKNMIRGTVLRALEYLVIGGGLLATGVVSAFITFTMAVRGNEVTVPNLVGSSLPEAGNILARAELNVRHEGNRFDASIPPDLVANQIPEAGTLLKKGRSVRVWTSLGPERRIVPRIEGESLQSAQLILEQEGFTIGRVVEVHSEAYAPDSIIAQNPAPYDDAGEAIEIDVLLSRGYLAKAYIMPDFMGQPIADVYDYVRQGGHRISSVRYVEYFGVPHGTVVRQTPQAGTKVTKRNRIILYVSKSY
jgi:beta-lactam-binding protein with PASTA domain